MARKRAATKEKPAAEATIDMEPLPVAAAGPAIATATEPPESAKDEAARQPAYAADPHEKFSVSLSDHRGGPSMHLLRSHRYRQMQVRFDGQQPDEQYLKMLTDAGWKDRTESEGIFTKQIDPNARWQSVAKMEEEFKAVANAIREAKGLSPVFEGLGA